MRQPYFIMMVLLLIAAVAALFLTTLYLGLRGKSSRVIFP